MFMLLLAELLNILTGNLKCQLYFCTCTSINNPFQIDMLIVIRYNYFTAL